MKMLTSCWSFGLFSSSCSLVSGVRPLLQHWASPVHSLSVGGNLLLLLFSPPSFLLLLLLLLAVIPLLSNSTYRCFTSPPPPPHSRHNISATRAWNSGLLLRVKPTQTASGQTVNKISTEGSNSTTTDRLRWPHFYKQ